MKILYKMKRITLLLLLIGIYITPYAQNCNLSNNTIVANTICAPIQTALSTGNYVLKARDGIILQPPFQLNASQFNGHTFTAVTDHTIANQQIIYEQTSTNSTPVPTLDQSNYIPGTLGGSVDVGSSGAASYQLPILISPGSNGMQPNLSIVYNSKSGNGLLGWGWNLAGISVISRSGKSQYYDGKFEPVKITAIPDALSMDGARLIMTSENNYYPENNPNTKVVFINNGFTVTTQDGTVMEYGLTDNSKAMTKWGTLPYAWAVNRITDQNKNYIDFVYVGNTQTGDQYISEIKYTGNSIDGKAPYNSIKFYYDAASYYSNRDICLGDYNTAFQRRIISAIKVFTEGAMTHEYKFDYFMDQFSKLSKISYTANGVKYNPTYIRWGESPSYQATEAILPLGETGQPWAPDYNRSQMHFGDFNGDGRTDIARFDTVSSKFTIGVAESNGGFTFYTKTLPKDIYTRTSDATYSSIIDSTVNFKIIDAAVVDYNNDGKDELILHHISYNHKIFLPRSTSVVEHRVVSYDNEVVYSLNGSSIESTTTYTANISPNFSTSTSFYYSDINNDGTVERFVVRNKYLVSCTGFTIPSPIKNIEGVQFNDVDGDGMPEMQVNSFDPTNLIATIEFYRASGTTLVHSGYDPINPGAVYPGDFNGDGLTDLIIGSIAADGGPDWNISLNDKWSIDVQVPFDGFAYSNGFNKIHIDDINNDGMDEIILAKKNTIYIYELIGTSFIQLASIVVDNDNSCAYLNTADLNGDGQKEIIFGTWSATKPYKYITFNSRLDRGLYVKSITDAMGNTSTFTYKTFADNRSFSTSFPKPQAPLALFRGPTQVVENLKTTNGATTLANVTYDYSDGRIHIAGRGFLGFSTLTSSNSVNGISTVSEFKYEIPNVSGIYYTWLKKQTVNKGNIFFSSVTNTMAAKSLDLSKKSFIPIIASSETTDFKGNIITKTIEGFNESLGRVTQQKLSTNDGWSITTSYDYTAVTSGGSRLSSVTTLTSSPNDTYSSTVTLGYANNSFPFRVTSRTGQGITTEFPEFDSYGNALKTKIGSRSTSCSYDDKGRFIVSSTDAAGNTSTAGYRPSDGLKLWEEDPKHNRTSIGYTNGGSSMVSAATLPNGNTSTTTLSWDNTYGQYKVENRITNGDIVTTYYNVRGQKTRVTSKGFAGADIITTYTYNQDGSLATEQKSGFPTVNYQYDEYDRIKSATNGETINLGYSYSGNDVTVNNIIAGTNKKESYSILGLLKQVSGSTGAINYDYFASGKVKEITSNGLTTSMTYDPLTLNQLTLTDPDAGTTTYTYNSYGQLETQKDSKGTTTTYNYEETLGGAIKSKVSGTEITETYEYFTENGQKGLPKSVTRNGITEAYTYDNLYRPVTATTTGDGKTFTTTNEYNNAGQLSHITYPTGLKVEYNYDNYGYLTDIFNDANKTTPLWHGSLKNSRQQWTEFSLGNGLTTKWGYDERYMLNTIKTGLGGNETSVQNLGFSFNTMGQLTSRTEGVLSESFVYDGDGQKFNRLTSSTVVGQSPVTYSYNTLGNITSTSLAGSYNYLSAKPHAVVEVTGITNPSGQSPTFTTSSTYTADNMVKEMDNGIYKNSFTYGPSGSRFKVDRYQANNLTSSKLYVGNSEFLLDNAGSITTSRTMVYAPTGICAVWEKGGASAGAFHYIHTDYLGSWLKITDQSGAVENSYSYDSWGRPRDPNTWVLKPISTVNALLNLNAMQPRFDRGYTGHEHMAGFGLINMNGRLYDPYLQRFLSPDRYVNSPTNSQSYNRYTYCLNNPLMYIDPSGWSELFNDETMALLGSCWGRTPDNGGGYFPVKNGVVDFANSFTFNTNGDIFGFNGDGSSYSITGYSIYITSNCSVGDGHTVLFKNSKIDHNLNWTSIQAMNKDGKVLFQLKNSEVIVKEDKILGIITQSTGGGKVEESDIIKAAAGALLEAIAGSWIPKKSDLAKAIWKESRPAMGASNNTSILSLGFRRFLNNTPPKPVWYLPKATSLGGQLGRLSSIVLRPIGWGLTVWSAYGIYQSWLDVYKPMDDLRYAPNGPVPTDQFGTPVNDTVNWNDWNN